MNIYSTKMYRKTDSYLLPLKSFATLAGHSDIYPAFDIQGEIYTNIERLAASIVSAQTVVIDGFEGVLWNNLIEQIVTAVSGTGKSVAIHSIESALKPECDIDALIAPFMGEKDSVFGRMTTLELIDFFDRNKLKKIRPSENADINILFGCGASLAGWSGLLIYADLPKSELQFRMAAGAAFNLGTKLGLDSRESYKRCYFIDWPILDSYKGRLIQQIDWILDEQRIDCYTYMSGDSFREALRQMCYSPIRPRPWFAPGVWGGTYMRDHFEGLNRNETNLAWSFELMALENGFLFRHDGLLLETSFSFLMSYDYRKVLGHCADDFKEDFPIRFDFLDTIQGDNLSIQCHPRPEYIRSQFGKHYTQDETYYIVRTTSDACVYLGFQEGIERDEFADAVRQSQATGKKMEITRYVQRFPSQKHSFFLIPNGTIHASGSGNLVLEISSAPYIFTFKMYDWMRLDMDGRPRPINIEHGLNNVRFERNGEIVKETLISKPRILEKNEAYTLEHLPTHPDHFYDVHRYLLHNGHRIEIETENRCHVWMVVEGKWVDVETANGRKEHYNYLETFIIPAAAKSYVFTNTSGNDVMLVKAFVKDSYTL